MLCRKPYMQGVLPFGCGQCLPCRLNRRRLWTHRIILESLSHTVSSFVTLTYSDGFIPKGGTLAPKDAQDWLKRLRFEIQPEKVRYYLVGEYGDQTWRPHYHVALFGVGRESTKLIESTWGKGHVLVGDLTFESSQYIAGYVTKKMTSKGDPRLEGRHPEFARMSRRPGIGALAVTEEVANSIAQSGFIDILNDGDVPLSLKHGGREWPLGRYLREKLREKLGYGPQIKEENRQKWMLEMREKAEAASQDPKNKSKSLGQILLSENKQKVRNLEARAKIFKKGGKI